MPLEVNGKIIPALPDVDCVACVPCRHARNTPRRDWIEAREARTSRLLAGPVHLDFCGSFFDSNLADLAV